MRASGWASTFVRSLLVIGLASSLFGCAPAAPSFAGGRTTPNGRTDLALGGSIRVPTGELVPQPESGRLELAAPGGAAPVAIVRHGITDDVELGLEAIGSTLRGSVRGQFPIGGGFELVLGAQPHATYAADGQAHAGGGGLLVPVVFALELFSLYEIWFGVRAGLEHLASDGAAVSGLRTGGVVGLAVGFRRLHVLAEIAVDHEYWWGKVGDTSIARNGIALTPGFALRLRL